MQNLVFHGQKQKVFSNHGFFPAAYFLFILDKMKRTCIPTVFRKGMDMKIAEIKKRHFKIRRELSCLLSELNLGQVPPVILCIGTDRMIGDSLGPLVGSLLARKRKARLLVYGTLSQPVHALNLDETLNEIKKKHPCSNCSRCFSW